MGYKMPHLDYKIYLISLTFMKTYTNAKIVFHSILDSRLAARVKLNLHNNISVNIALPVAENSLKVSD